MNIAEMGACDLTAIREFIAGVDGWLTDAEGQLLFSLARQCRQDHAIVEIGSWKGKSTVWLAKGSQSGKRANVYAVDPHVGSPEHHAASGQVWTFPIFQSTIESAGCTDVVTPLVIGSQEAAANFHEPVGVLFVDGNHDYEMVKADLECWFPKVVDGGIIAFHDTNVAVYPGVERLMREAVFRARHFKNIRWVDSITYGTKVARNSLADVIRNRCGEILRYPDAYRRSLRWDLVPGGVRKLALRAMRRFHKQRPQGS